MDKHLTPLSEERSAGLDERERPPKEDDPPGKSYRTPAQRDRDRILYSSAFQRLAYVTQVTASESGHTFHNRLSHSLKVAQVGRRNAERLRQLADKGEITGAAATLVEALDPDAVEASCLAHDLGHPPFGHIAEQTLQAEGEGRLPDAFEGNAQSFRIVTRLAVREKDPGLNLTRRTLDGLLKYPWAHRSTDICGKRDRKWGYYQEDAEAFAFARDGWPDEVDDALPERCLAAEIMDWADDLTYAVHDVDDFYRAGLIPLDRLREDASTELKRLEALLNAARAADPAAFPSHDIDAMIEAVRSRLSLYGPGEPYEHTWSARATMRQLGSELITDYLNAFSVVDDPTSGKVKLTIDDAARCEVEAFKMLAVVYVIRRPGLAVVQHGQKKVIGELFDVYYKASAAGKKGDRRIFPPGPLERLQKSDGRAEARTRVVIDLIAGLTETSAVKLHQRLCAGGAATTLDATARMG